MCLFKNNAWHRNSPGMDPKIQLKLQKSITLDHTTTLYQPPTAPMIDSMDEQVKGTEDENHPETTTQHNTNPPHYTTTQMDSLLIPWRHQCTTHHKNQQRNTVHTPTVA